MKEAFTHKSLLILGRGIGQVMFQNNALSGLLMLIGIFLNSSLILMAIASCASTYIARFLNMQRMLPGFTTLFILSVWMLLGLCSLLMPDMLLVSDTETPASSSINYLQCFSMSIGQVMFQGNIMTGLFFLAGILVNSR